MSPGALVALLLAAAPGRIEGVVSFKGRSFKPLKAASADPTCKSTLIPWEPRAVVRLAGPAPTGPALPAPAVIEARGCAYRPWLSAVVKGQPVLLRNADGTTHSVKATQGDQVLFHVIQPAGSSDLAKDPLVAGPIRLGCDLHPWMAAFVLVSDHPYFAVTDDAGKFSLEVPAGTWAVEAWNPKLGTLKAEVTVEEGKAADPKFSFSPR